MFYKKEGYPENSDIVLCTVKKILYCDDVPEEESQRALNKILTSGKFKDPWGQLNAVIEEQARELGCEIEKPESAN